MSIKNPKVYFVYKTINVINSKYYIGVHYGKISDSYLGSGKAIKHAIAKYGKESFIRNVLAVFDSKEPAYELEKQLVTEEEVQNPMSYNQKIGGIGGWDHVDSSGDKNCMKRPEVVNKVSLGIKLNLENNSEELERRRERMSRLRKDGTIQTANKGQKTSPEAIAKRVESRKRNNKPNKNLGRKAGPDRPEVRENKRLAAIKRCETKDMGLTRGLTYEKHECPHCGKIGGGGNMIRYHYDNCKQRTIAN